MGFALKITGFDLRPRKVSKLVTSPGVRVEQRIDILLKSYFFLLLN